MCFPRDYAAGSDYELGAAWTSRWLEMFADGFERLGLPPSERFVLSRATRAGAQRHGFAMWSGDTKSCWGELKQQAPNPIHPLESLQTRSKVHALVESYPWTAYTA